MQTRALEILAQWAERPSIRFSRECYSSASELACDCSGLFKLLFEDLGLGFPFNLERPKALHYFSVLQEIGSPSILSLEAGHILAWRKDFPPRSGDTGHVLLAAGTPVRLDEHRYSLSVYDSTKRAGGLSRREIELFTDAQGQLIGCRLHPDDSKIKRTQIYHAAPGEPRYCWGCTLPKKVCQCGVIEPRLLTPNVLVLRHPDERGRTLSTVSLIKQRYPNVLVREGEVFSPPRLKNMALLYPVEEGQRACENENLSDEYLILLDATWRKAKKILHLNPWLNALPKVSLDADQVSQYLLRKVANDTDLSSVEAFALAVQDESLNSLFAHFMRSQIALMGEDVYRRNYAGHLNYQP